MAEVLEKFVSRAPRYQIRPVDNQFLRFANQGDQSKSFTTQFLDISVTGLAFIIEMENAPGIGEVIKMEVPLDGSDSIAWFGEVVRIETYNPGKWWLNEELSQSQNIVLIGVRFKDLPDAHRNKIKQTIRKKIVEVQKENNRRTFANLISYAQHHKAQFVFYFLAFFATVWFLYMLAQPGPNYDSEKGSPWGQRYPQFNLFEKNMKPYPKER